MINPLNYQDLKSLISGKPLPAALVDLDRVLFNIRFFVEAVRGKGKHLRLASKSVRVPGLMRFILDEGKESFRGLMCYSAPEALFLAERGFDDFLLGYPTVQESDLEAVRQLVTSGKRIVLMVDEDAHLDRLESYWSKNGPADAQLSICVDVDMSYRPGFGLHLGVLRSPLRTLEEAIRIIDRTQKSPHLRLAGIMGYEAQIAGLPDSSPFTPFKNPLVRLFKKISGRDVYRRREALARYLEREGVKIDFFNAGGSGSISSSAVEPWVTEVTVGSGLLQSHLFDYYQGVRREPALFFALPITRVPAAGVVTCQSGGFIASGAVGPDKAPRPFLPGGMESFPDEGFGEVQTPLADGSGLVLGVGDPVFFRPAKAGEIAERFSSYYLVRQGALVGTAETYRGLGQCFY